MSEINCRRLQAGEEVSLHEIDPGLHRVQTCLGWTAPEKHNDFVVDLDASAFLVGMGDRVRMDTDFIFYNNLSTEGGVIKHLGDNVSGEVAGWEKVNDDCERIEVDMDNIPFDVEKVVFTVTIHNCEERQQNLSILKDVYIRVINAETKAELARFDLPASTGEEDAVMMAELYRLGVSWQFKAIGQGVIGGLYKIAKDFDVNVAPL